ncbi:MAG: hypothetical protein KA826_08015 [Ottowia sp.]|nr:hypothetical protein [Ottowia sp.]
MRGAFKRRLAPVWRGVGLLSASLILSLTTLAPAAAAPAKKAKAADARPAAKAKPAAPSKSTAAKPASKQVAAKATSGKAAKTAPQVAAKGKAAKADVQEAKASKRDRGGKSAKRAFAEERRGGKTNVARGSDSVQRTLSARNGKAHERAERLAARETRLAIRTVAHVPQEARPARLSFGQLAGLRGVEDPLELKSSVALVLDQDTHEVLLSKNDHAVLPIASLTKLMTGLIVSDARLPLDEMISITEDDIDYEKGSRSRLPVGTTLTRGELMHLALMSSENRAAHALGRTFPGGMQRFVGLMNARAMMLGMKDTRYVEPTGLSSENRSSAYDLATLVNTAAQDPLLRQLSTSQGYEVAVGNRVLQYNNTNRLVHNPDWQIGLQKTGYISEAGQCLVMQARVAGRKLIMVFLDSSGKYSRLADAERVRRWVEFERAPTNTAASNPYAG